MEKGHDPAGLGGALNFFNIIYRFGLRLTKLERAVKGPPSPATYHNEPALVEQVVILTLTLNMARLEKQSLLKWLKPVSVLHPLNLPPPPPLANVSSPLSSQYPPSTPTPSLHPRHLLSTPGLGWSVGGPPNTANSPPPLLSHRPQQEVPSHHQGRHTYPPTITPLSLTDSINAALHKVV